MKQGSENGVTHLPWYKAHKQNIIKGWETRKSLAEKNTREYSTY